MGAKAAAPRRGAGGGGGGAVGGCRWPGAARVDCGGAAPNDLGRCGGGQGRRRGGSKRLRRQRGDGRSLITLPPPASGRGSGELSRIRALGALGSFFKAYMKWLEDALVITSVAVASVAPPPPAQLTSLPAHRHRLLLFLAVSADLVPRLWFRYADVAVCKCCCIGWPVIWPSIF